MSLSLPIDQEEIFPFVGSVIEIPVKYSKRNPKCEANDITLEVSMHQTGKEKSKLGNYMFQVLNKDALVIRKANRDNDGSTTIKVKLLHYTGVDVVLKVCSPIKSKPRIKTVFSDPFLAVHHRLTVYGMSNALAERGEWYYNGDLEKFLTFKVNMKQSDGEPFSVSDLKLRLVVYYEDGEIVKDQSILMKGQEITKDNDGMNFNVRCRIGEASGKTSKCRHRGRRFVLRVLPMNSKGRVHTIGFADCPAICVKSKSKAMKKVDEHPSPVAVGKKRKLQEDRNDPSGTPEPITQDAIISYVERTGHFFHSMILSRQPHSAKSNKLTEMDQSINQMWQQFTDLAISPRSLEKSTPEQQPQYGTEDGYADGLATVKSVKGIPTPTGAAQIGVFDQDGLCTNENLLAPTMGVATPIGAPVPHLDLVQDCPSATSALVSSISTLNTPADTSLGPSIARREKSMNESGRHSEIFRMIYTNSGNSEAKQSGVQERDLKLLHGAGRILRWLKRRPSESSSSCSFDNTVNEMLRQYRTFVQSVVENSPSASCLPDDFLPATSPPGPGTVLHNNLNEACPSVTSKSDTLSVHNNTCVGCPVYRDHSFSDVHLENAAMLSSESELSNLFHNFDGLSHHSTISPGYTDNLTEDDQILFVDFAGELYRGVSKELWPPENSASCCCKEEHCVCTHRGVVADPGDSHTQVFETFQMLHHGNFE